MRRYAGGLRRIAHRLAPLLPQPPGRQWRTPPHDALAVIAGHHGLQLTAKPWGAPFDPIDQLRAWAADAGLHSRLLRFEMASLDRMRLPCLVHHHHLGWVPLVAVKHGQVTVHAPGHGPMTLPDDVLALEFSGLAVEFKLAA